MCGIIAASSPMRYRPKPSPMSQLMVSRMRRPQDRRGFCFDCSSFDRHRLVADLIGADGGTRTLTGNLPRDFKSLASTIPPRPPRLLNDLRRVNLGLLSVCPECGEIFFNAS